jgi:hypothetical protein
MFGRLEVDDELVPVAVGDATMFAHGSLHEVERIVVWLVISVLMDPHTTSRSGDRTTVVAYAVACWSWWWRLVITTFGAKGIEMSSPDAHCPSLLFHGSRLLQGAFAKSLPVCRMCGLLMYPLMPFSL